MLYFRFWTNKTRDNQVQYYSYRKFPKYCCRHNQLLLPWRWAIVASSVYLFQKHIHMKNTRKIWREKNREKINAKAKEWREKNKEKVKAIKKKHYEKNKEKVLARRRVYMKEWRKNNQDKCKEYALKRRSKNIERVTLTREERYLSYKSWKTCHDHLSNQEIRVLPMNVSSQSPTETFDFKIAWLRDLSQNAQTINE